MKKPKRPSKATKKPIAKPVESKPEQVILKSENEPVEWDYFAPPYGYRRAK